MSDLTKIQWCHSTVNPIMGCGGCELFPSPGEVLTSLDTALAGFGTWPNGQSRKVYRALILAAFERIPKPLDGHSSAVSTTNIWHFRAEFLAHVNAGLGAASARAADMAIGQAITCYAAKGSHCMM